MDRVTMPQHSSIEGSRKQTEVVSKPSENSSLKQETSAVVDSTVADANASQLTQAAEPGKSSPALIAVRAIAFIVLAALLFTYLNLAFTNKGNQQNKGNIEEFYLLEPGIVDVMYIGTSASSRLFVNPMAFNDYGIASYTFGIQSGPLFFSDNLIKESQLTQSPSLYIIELREVTKQGSSRIPLTLDSLSLFSMQRPNMSWKATKYDDPESNTTFIDYLFPITRYHERLLQGDMKPEDYLLQVPDRNLTQGFRISTVTVTEAPQEGALFTDKIGELYPDRQKQLNDLLDFCDTLDADVLFVFTPFAASQKRLEMINAAQEIVESRGYTVLNCNDEALFNEIGIDWKTDFYNENHTNYLGAEKYTNYLSRYLKEHYDLPDRRGDSTYDAWVEGYKIYKDYTKDGIVYTSKENVSDEA